MGRLMSRPLVCVTLSGYTVDEVLKDAAVATAAGADLVEVRLDLLWAREKEIDPSANSAAVSYTHLTLPTILLV